MNIYNETDKILSNLSVDNSYFIINQNIHLQAGKQYVLGKGSVIAFEGGRFIGGTGTVLNLNGAHVIADPYTIFSNLEVTGFSNDEVRAEWFKEDVKESDQIYINRALNSANGCPVVLLPKDYYIDDSIIMPAGSTLVCRGIIYINAGTNPDIIGIDIHASNVRLDINNLIAHDDRKPEDDENDSQMSHQDNQQEDTEYLCCTGIKISGSVYHVSVNVNTIRFPLYGIKLMPGKIGASANMQYLNINFQCIEAGTGIYIDIFSTGNPSDIWLTRCNFNGGRLIGYHGVIMADSTDGSYEFSDFNDNNHINELNFKNIGFENLTKTAIRLRHATRLRFDYIRMAENLSKTEPWIDFKDVSWVSFSINGGLFANKYTASGSCSRITIKGTVIRTTGWSGTPFDTLIIESVYNPAANNYIPRIMATDSVQPFPITGTVTDNSDLGQLLPAAIPAVAGQFNGVKVLPRMAYINISKDTTINLTGLNDFVPCVYYFYLESKATLTLRSNVFRFYPPTQKTSDINIQTFKYPDNPDKKYSLLTVSNPGLYQMVWTVENTAMKLVVQPVK